jgi:hypothetical protein
MTLSGFWARKGCALLYDITEEVKRDINNLFPSVECH